MKIIRAFAVLSLTFVLGACVSSTVDMTYNGSGIAATGKPVITVSDVTDNRAEGDPHRLGAIRSGFGTPMKTITTKQPASDVVKAVLTEGLKARGLYADKPRYSLAAVIQKFDCSQYARREAHVLLDVTVLNNATKSQVFSKQVKVDKVNGSAVTFDAGVFASSEDLRAIANEALQEAVDTLLNDPKFLAAIRS